MNILLCAAVQYDVQQCVRSLAHSIVCTVHSGADYFNCEQLFIRSHLWKQSVSEVNQ